MQEQFYISRHSFLARCIATAAATGLPLWFVQEQQAGAAEAAASKPSLPSPNDRPGIALVGCGIGRDASIWLAGPSFTNRSGLKSNASLRPSRVAPSAR